MAFDYFLLNVQFLGTKATTSKKELIVLQLEVNDRSAELLKGKQCCAMGLV